MPLPPAASAAPVALTEKLLITAGRLGGDPPRPGAARGGARQRGNVVAAAASRHGAGGGPGIPRGPENPQPDQRRKPVHLPPVARIGDDLRALAGGGAGGRGRADARAAASAAPARRGGAPPSPAALPFQADPGAAARLHVVLAPDLAAAWGKGQLLVGLELSTDGQRGMFGARGQRARCCRRISAWWNGSPRITKAVPGGMSFVDRAGFLRTARRAGRSSAPDARPSRGGRRATPRRCARRCARVSWPDDALELARPMARRQPRSRRRGPGVAAARGDKPARRSSPSRPACPRRICRCWRNRPAVCRANRPPRSSTRNGRAWSRFSTCARRRVPAGLSDRRRPGARPAAVRPVAGRFAQPTRRALQAVYPDGRIRRTPAPNRNAGWSASTCTAARRGSSARATSRPSAPPSPA